MDDCELLRRYVDGDRTAVEQMVRTYQPQLTRFAAAILNDRELAHDAVQETFIHLWKSRPSSFDGKLITYLLTVIRNICIDIIRKKRINYTELSETIIVDGSFQDTIRMKILSDAVNAALIELPPIQRQIFILSEYEGFTYQEIASFLECPVNTVASRKHAAMESLRKMLLPYLQGDNE